MCISIQMWLVSRQLDAPTMMSQGEQEAVMELLRNEPTTQERLDVISEVHSYFFSKASGFPWLHLLPTIQCDHPTHIYWAHNRQMWGMSNSKTWEDKVFCLKDLRSRGRQMSGEEKVTRWRPWSKQQNTEYVLDTIVRDLNYLSTPTTQMK